MKWKFDVDCRCLLRAREGVRVRCDVMLQKELLPLLVTLRCVGEVKDACEMEKAMGEDKVVFVDSWVVVYEVFSVPGIWLWCECLCEVVGVGMLGVVWCRVGVLVKLPSDWLLRRTGRVSCRSSKWLLPWASHVSAKLGCSLFGILARMAVISLTCSVSSGLLCCAIHFWILVAL